MKGIDIVVKGSIGPMSAFMAQTGNLVVLGDAGGSAGDSIYEARLFVRGKVGSPARIARKSNSAAKSGLSFRICCCVRAWTCPSTPFDCSGRRGGSIHFHVDNAY